MENIIKAVLEQGVDSLGDHCKLTTSIQLKPKSAHPGEGVQDILSRLDSKGAFTSEYKYDGERAQIHILDKKVKIYIQPQPGRQLYKVPGCGEDSRGHAEGRSGQLHHRLRDSGLGRGQEGDSAVPGAGHEETLGCAGGKHPSTVCIYAFDMVCLSGSCLVPKSLRRRRQAMKEIANGTKNI